MGASDTVGYLLKRESNPFALHHPWWGWGGSSFCPTGPLLLSAFLIPTHSSPDHVKVFIFPGMRSAGPLFQDLPAERPADASLLWDRSTSSPPSLLRSLRDCSVGTGIIFSNQEHFSALWLWWRVKHGGHRLWRNMSSLILCLTLLLSVMLSEAEARKMELV